MIFIFQLAGRAWSCCIEKVRLEKVKTPESEPIRPELFQARWQGPELNWKSNCLEKVKTGEREVAGRGLASKGTHNGAPKMAPKGATKGTPF